MAIKSYLTTSAHLIPFRSLDDTWARSWRASAQGELLALVKEHENGANKLSSALAGVQSEIEDELSLAKSSI